MNRRHRLISGAASFVPPVVRRLIRSKFSMQNFDLARRIESNPYRDQRSVVFEESEYTLGIIEEVTQYHQYYIAACLDLKVSFKVLPLLDDNWIELFRKSGCDGYLVWPSSFPSTSKQVYDDRLFMLENELNATLFPSWKECWLTEHKPRLRDWMVINNIPHPETWVFYDQHSALEFAANVKHAVVVKTATGAGASGVSIVKNKQELSRIVRLAFSRGLRPSSYSPYDRQRGYVFIQKYYPKIEEWRMVRMGDAYFGHKKGVGKSGMHSGSDSATWEDPGSDLLNLTRELTEKGNFESMDVDVFKTDNGKLLVNECQTVFGCTVATTQMKIDNKPGHYQFRDGTWVFVEGDICQNHLCNLRIKRLLNQLKFGDNRCTFE